MISRPSNVASPRPQRLSVSHLRLRFTIMQRIALLLTAALAFAPAALAQTTLRILPEKIELTGQEASQRFLVQQIVDGRVAGQITGGVDLKPKTDGIVRVADGRVIAVGEGQTELIATDATGNTATAMVIVRLADVPQTIRFASDVQAVLAKASCNSGACHGALAGKGGFRLSLLGYDSHGDYFNISQQLRGRRVELADPARSLIVAKPSGMIPHKGGVRLPKESDDYKLLLDWISAGAPGPSDEDPSLAKIEVLPKAVRLAKGDTQQLVVRAHYSNGRIKDVTQWVRWSSTNDAAARVDDQGMVTVTGPGVGAITAWFASQIVIANVTVPYAQEVSEAQFAKLQPRNFIDREVLRQLKQLNIPPSDRAGESEFLRRAYLDTIGRLPSIDETQSYLADDSPDKRDQLIEQLLVQPEFVDYWSYRWSDILLVNGSKLRPKAVESFYQWIRSHVEAGTPWDVFVREILTSRGSSFENGATNFFANHQTPEEMTENASQAFLGLSIACAKCHNHPLEKWTNDQYYAMANLFARVRAKGWGGDSRNGDGNRTLVVLDRGDLIQPLTGKPQPPAPLDAPPMEIDDPADRREYLADWLTAPENPYFARSITNRVWANFFGVGLVESVDDMRVSNPASNEALLAAASQHLIDSGFDLKSLMRTILQSETYQRSSQSLPENAAEKRFYSHYYPRRLMAEVLLDAISDVTDAPTEFTQISFPGADMQKTDLYPKGTRALQLYDSAVASYFLQTFGRNTRDITCECERSDEPSVVQVLHLSNGDTINQKLAAKENRLSRWIADGLDDGTIIDQVFLAALSRQPTAQEREALLASLQGQEDRRQALEDLVWSVLSSSEFLLAH